MSVAATLVAPKTLGCPHCGGQMNLTGRGRAAGSVTYICLSCVPALQVKELWHAQVVRTGNLGFGFVQILGARGVPALRFNHLDCRHPSGHKGSRQPPQIGERCLVLLASSLRRVLRVWRLPPPAPAGRTRPARQGVITALKAPDWGFVTELGTGTSWFVHQTDVVGGRPLTLGQRVTFVPGHGPQGPKACEVRWVK